MGSFKNLIHYIGLISFVSIALSTMALLLVLFVFNGLEDLVKSLFRSFDPDIKVELKKGKSFVLDTDLMGQIKAIEGVVKVVDVIEDNALLCYQGRQMVVKLKGVSEDFIHQNCLAAFIKQGSFKLKQEGKDFAIIGNGVQHALSVHLANHSHVLQIFYPRDVKGNTSISSPLYQCKNITAGAVFAVEKRFDENHVIVPVDFAATLMDMDGERTALEIQVAAGFSTDEIQRKLRECVPDSFQVLNSNEQQATLMQAIHIERLFVFLTFSLILLVASLNVFFVLSMLVLDKRQDIATMYTLGATSRDIKRIFLMEGLFIALSGAALGMIAAWVLSWLQQTFGVVSLGTETSLVEAYPIRRKASDFVYTAVSIVVMALIAVYPPAYLATKAPVEAQR